MPTSRAGLRVAVGLCTAIATAGCEQLTTSCAGAGACPAPTCTDGVQNGDEQGVDCGGSCPSYCVSLLPGVEVTNLAFSTGPLAAPYDPHAAAIEVESLYSGMDFTITVSGTPGGLVLLDESPVALNQPFAMQVPALAPDAAIRLRYRDTSGALVEQAIRTLPSDLPTYQVTADDPIPGRIFLGPSDVNEALTPFLLLLDAAGRPLFYRRLAFYSFDFKWHELPDGTVRYSYYSARQAHVMDDHFRVLAAYRILATDRHGDFVTDGHDFLLLDDNHYIVGGLVPMPADGLPAELAGGNPAPYVCAAVIQEIRDGQLLFEWDSTQHPELYAMSTEGNDFAASSAGAAADYAHWNSVQVDPADGNWLLSFRHLDAIVKVSRQDGSIMWILGGTGDQFGLSAAQKFSHQHHARFLTGRDLLLFDNGNAVGQSRLVRLTLDEGQKRVESYDELGGSRYSDMMGSVQVSSPATLFIGWGESLTGGSAVDEIEPTSGRVRFSLTFDAAYTSYRALKWVDPS